jgi:tRNA threonylcarbamoyladenosine biosynthesis protein TsaB
MMPAMIARLHFRHVSHRPDAEVPVFAHGAPDAAMNAPLLAFDTSTEVMAVAVQSPTQLFTCTAEGGALASARLIPQILLLLQQAGLDWPQLRAIAFGHGPGAFTGLRTACAVAQGLAFGASLPVLAVDSLLIVAEGVRVEHAHAAPDIDVALDARMGEVYAGRYRWSGTRWQRRTESALYTLDGLNALWADEPPQCVCGSALQAFGNRLDSGAALRVDAPVDRAAALMRLAQQLWRASDGVDAAQALPLYLRDKVAFTVSEQHARRAIEAGT